MTKQLNLTITELAFLIESLSASASTTRKTIKRVENGLGINPDMLQRELDLLEGMISQAATAYNDLYLETKESEKI